MSAQSRTHTSPGLAKSVALPPGGMAISQVTSLPPGSRPMPSVAQHFTTSTPSSKRSHHTASAVAGMSQQPTQQALAGQLVQPVNQAIRGPAGQPSKKRRRAGDRVLPPEIGDLVPEYHAYMNFLAFERKLDALITRKRLEMQETLKKPLKVRRRLRIYVSHTFYPGKAPEKEGDEGSIAQWELRVEGRLMDDESTKLGQTMSKRKFSSFFKSLVIELDKEVYGPDNHLVEWHRTATTNETDGFQVKRPGDRSVKCTILLLLDHVPMKFKLDPRLARILGIYTETRPRIIEALWEYIKKHKLQDAHERDHVNCDKYLEQTFQCQRMRFIEIPQRLHGLLMPPDPIVIHHVITCNPDGLEPKKTACYDIDVEVDDPVKAKMSMFLGAQQNQNDIAACDNRIYEIVEQIQQVKMQREFYLGFSQNPKEFVEKWIISQSKDLKLMTDMSGQSEEERKADYYDNAWINEAVGRYFYGKVQQKRVELEQTLGVRSGC